jgi:hypothetical protein
MNIFYRSLPFACFVAAIASVPVKCAEPEVSLTVSVSQTTFKAGSEIAAKIVLWNKSTQAIPVAVDFYPGAEADYRAEVLGSDGKPAPRTEYGRKFALGGFNSSVGNAVLGPLGSKALFDEPDGDKITSTMVINKLFDLSKPGKYSVQVSREVGKANTLVKSNIITVTIAP